MNTAQRRNLKIPWAFITHMRVMCFFSKIHKLVILLKSFIAVSASINYSILSKHFPMESNWVSLQFLFLDFNEENEYEYPHHLRPHRKPSCLAWVWELCTAALLHCYRGPGNATSLLPSAAWWYKSGKWTREGKTGKGSVFLNARMPLMNLLSGIYWVPTMWPTWCFEGEAKSLHRVIN